MTALFLDERMMQFAIVAAALTMSPGINAMLVIRSTIVEGKSAARWLVAGFMVGPYVLSVLGACGLALFLKNAPNAAGTLRWIAVVYLAYLGVSGIYKAINAPPSLEDDTAPGSGFLTGMTTDMTNPKVLVFYLTVVPQFVPTGDPILARTLAMATVHNLIKFAWFNGVILSIAWIRPVLQSKRAMAWLQIVGGAVLLVIAALSAR